MPPEPTSSSSSYRPAISSPTTRGRMPGPVDSQPESAPGATAVAGDLGPAAKVGCDRDSRVQRRRRVEPVCEAVAPPMPAAVDGNVRGRPRAFGEEPDGGCRDRAHRELRVDVRLGSGQPREQAPAPAGVPCPVEADHVPAPVVLARDDPGAPEEAHVREQEQPAAVAARRRQRDAPPVPTTVDRAKESAALEPAAAVTD